MKSIRPKADFVRSEREGALHLRIKEGAVQDLQLRIFKLPRFVESFLCKRNCSEIPRLTARICGICPVAYQMSAVHAVENAFGITIAGPVHDLRRLLYFGEWIESHALSIYMLHAPGFLGYPSAIEMAEDQIGMMKRGLKLKRTGSEIVALLGGKKTERTNICPGGFRNIPTEGDLAGLGEHLKWARDAALETVQWVALFPFPDVERDYEFVSLSHPDEYPLNEGHVVSNKGLDIEVSMFENYLAEERSGYSTVLRPAPGMRREYVVGPLARYNLNFDRLTDIARESAEAAGVRPPCRNPFKSIVIRAVEILNACEEAIRLIQNYELPDKPSVEMCIREGSGFACTEAPRGILYHRYGLDSGGNVLNVRIIPPTSQNQKSMEEDLRQFIPRNSDLNQDELSAFCAQAIRNYDPCISCTGASPTSYF